MSFHFKVSIEGQKEYFVELDKPMLKVGSLLSNEIVLQAEGVASIHGLVEDDGGTWKISDLGSDVGISVNGKKIEVVQELAVDDVIEIGEAKITFTDELPKDDSKSVTITGESLEASLPPIPPPVISKKAKTKAKEVEKAAPVAKKKTETKSSSKEQRRRADLLFKPRTAKASGSVLEVINYWDDRILGIEHFHPTIKGYEQVLLGDQEKAHFVGSEFEGQESHILADVSNEGYTLHLGEGMSARLRKAKGVENAGPGSHQLSRRDIAHVRHGNSRYFFIFMRVPTLDLPKAAPEDPFAISLFSVMMVIYLMLTAGFYTTDPKEKDKFDEDMWAVVHLPEKIKDPKKADIKKAKKAPVKKPPPPPKPKPVEPAKPKEKPKPKPKKEKKTTATTKDLLTKAKTQKKPKGKSNQPKRGGAGNNKKGGARKGDKKISVNGAKGAKNNKSSGVNLAKLGLGVGNISSKTGLGAIHTDFKNSAGGAGGGSGLAAKNFGLGGTGTDGKNLGLAGSEGAVQRFGHSQGGITGSDMGSEFGTNRVAEGVNLRAGDPLISGGLSQEEVRQVVLANNKSIRHCYNQLIQRSPDASGTIKVSFVIGVNGRVSTAKIASSSFNDSGIKNCITSVVKRMQFPPPRGGQSVSITYPWEFSSLD